MKQPNELKQRKFWQMVQFEAKQFCYNTSLHGYRYIILPKRILLEKVVWILIILVAIASVLTLLLITWFHLQDNPAILVIDSHHHPIWFYPFPAVTFCSYNMISKSKAYDLARTLTLRTFDTTLDDIVWDLRLLSQLSYHNDPSVPKLNYTRLQDILEMNDISIDVAIKKLAPSCKKLIQKCKWKGQEMPCESIFEKILTSDGWCCSFNYYAQDIHAFPRGKNIRIPKKPRRVAGCGYRTGLEVILNTNTSDYLATHLASFGHKMFVTNPYNYIDRNSPMFFIEMKELTFVGIIPTLTEATESLKELKIDERKCLIHHERKLSNFAHYTHHNCIVECRMNVTQRLCGCIPFYYHNLTQSPNETFHSHKVCAPRDFLCLDEHYSEIFSSVPGFNFNEIPKDHKFGAEVSECDCLQDCEDVEYSMVPSSGVLKRSFSSSNIDLFAGISIKNQSVMRVYFNDLTSIQNRRDVVYTWHTVFGYYGGLLGLFVGFSFVSLFEMIYFFTFRLIADAKASNIKTKTIKVQPAFQYQELNPGKLYVNRKI